MVSSEECVYRAGRILVFKSSGDIPLRCNARLSAVIRNDPVAAKIGYGRGEKQRVVSMRQDTRIVNFAKTGPIQFASRIARDTATQPRLCAMMP